ncbi:DUF4439 domain-containing protein [Kineococcus auxinigenes]|uniref:DUF4439 domain-containing protein n=1 Tax=unclassified Kineococcus TaxID=2621656 RepID=UPI003D7CC112
MPALPRPAQRAPAADRRAPDRRTALAALAALAGTPLVAGCGVRWVSGAEPTPTAQRGPDDEARERAVDDAHRLLAQALALAPAGAGATAPATAPAAVQQVAVSVADACTAHLRALGADPVVPASAQQSAPGDASALAQELAAAAARALDALDGVGGGMARLLCSVAASRVLLADATATAAGASPPRVPVVPAPSSAPAAPSSPSPDAGGVAALQAVLAGEHAAVWCYGLVAGRLVDEPRARALAAAVAHRAVRDDLTGTLRARGAEPVGAQAAYDAAAPTAEAARLLAASVEERLTAVYADLAAASRADRALAAAGVLRTAGAARGWGGTTVNLPGLPATGEDGLPLPTGTTTAPADPTPGA